MLEVRRPDRERGGDADSFERGSASGDDQAPGKSVADDPGGRPRRLEGQGGPGNVDSAGGIGDEVVRAIAQRIGDPGTKSLDRGAVEPVGNRGTGQITVGARL